MKCFSFVFKEVDLHVDGIESVEMGRASKFFEDLDQRILQPQCKFL